MHAPLRAKSSSRAPATVTVLRCNYVTWVKSNILFRNYYSFSVILVQLFTFFFFFFFFLKELCANAKALPR